MDSEPIDFSRVHPLFDELIGLSGERRTARLRDIEADDPRLARFLVEMLLADEQGTAELFSIDRDALRPAAIGPPMERDRTDAYDLHETIGRGSYGVVYRATQRSSGKVVAVKVLRDPLASPVQRSRFIREIKSLGVVNHPRIAPLIDAGRTDSGGLFLVTEFIEGRRLDRAIAEDRPPLETRLAIFKQILDGVAHLHDRGVVHRDLKPSNILVETTADGDHHVRIIDLGIARLNDRSAGATITEDGAIVGTPAYMAPEQFRSGGAVTPAADVFSLGAVLFETLVGSPLRSKHRTESMTQFVYRTIDRIEDRPSTIAKARETYAESYPGLPWRTIRGDLEAIVLKAIHPDVEERYPTAREMLADLHRHERSLPVLARKPTFFYEASRVVRRHRGAMTVIAAAIVALFVATGAIVWAVTDARSKAETLREAERQSRLMQASAALARNDIRGALAAIDGRPTTFPERLLAAFADNAERSLQLSDRRLTHLGRADDGYWTVDASGRMFFVGDDLRLRSTLETRAAAERAWRSPDDPSRVYLLGAGRVTAVDLQSKTILWTRFIEGFRPSDIRTAAGRLIVFGEDRRSAIDTESGEIVETPIELADDETRPDPAGDEPPADGASFRTLADEGLAITFERAGLWLSLRDAATGRQLDALRGAGGAIERFTASIRDGTLDVAAVDRTGRMLRWRLAPSRLAQMRERTTSVLYPGDDRTLHTAAGGFVELVEAERAVRITGDRLVTIVIDGGPSAVTLAGGDPQRLLIGAFDGRLHVIDGPDWSSRRVLPVTGSTAIRTIASSPDGSTALVGCHDGSVIAVDLGSGSTETVARLTEPIAGVGVTADGSWVIAGGDSGSVKVLAAGTGALAATWTASDGPLRRIEPAASGWRFESVSSDAVRLETP